MRGTCHRPVFLLRAGGILAIGCAGAARGAISKNRTRGKMTLLHLGAEHQIGY